MSDILTLAAGAAIIEAAFAKGAELGLKPLTVAVLDAGGHLIALSRQDGASNLRPEIAIGKATAALDLGISSRKVAVMAEERPQFVGALAALSGKLVPAAGGVLVAGPEGRVIGAVGITGDTSDNDEACAHHGIKTAGLAFRD